MSRIDHIIVKASPTDEGTVAYLHDNEAVSFAEAQTLTDAQKTQVRENIEAGSAQDVSDLKSQMNELDEYVNIEVDSDKSYYHNNDNIQSVTVSGNDYAFSNVILANRKNIVPIYPSKEETKNGTTIGNNDRFVYLSGTSTGDHTYRTSPGWYSIDNIEAGDYKLIIKNTGRIRQAIIRCFMLR